VVGSPVGGVGVVGKIVVGQYQVPAVAAVFAAVGHDVARQPLAVFARRGEEVATATTIHTDDGGLRFQHAPSLACMRVIAGEFGGRVLVAPEGLTTRPTTDKVRQAVFNSLHSMGVVEGAVVADLFAGSGALGIEALSRGAEHCTFVERDRSALHALRTNIDTLGLAPRSTVHATDVMAWVPAMRNIDIAFIDPPYAFDGWAELLGLLADVGLVVAEADDPVAAPPGWVQQRSRRYGRTWVTLLERDGD